MIAACFLRSPFIDAGDSYSLRYLGFSWNDFLICPETSTFKSTFLNIRATYRYGAADARQSLGSRDITDGHSIHHTVLLRRIPLWFPTEDIRYSVPEFTPGP